MLTPRRTLASTEAFIQEDKQVKKLRETLRITLYLNYAPRYISLYLNYAPRYIDLLALFHWLNHSWTKI